MRKRLLSVIVTLLCAMACVFGLVACGNNADPGEDDNGEPQTVAVESVALDKTELTLEIGGEETLAATVSPENATDKAVVWSSDNTAVATVADGKVTAVAAGTATITATADGKSATCSVTVNTPISYTVTEAEWVAILTGVNSPLGDGGNMTVELFAKHSDEEYALYFTMKFDWEHKAASMYFFGDGLKYCVYEEGNRYTYTQSESGEWTRRLWECESAEQMFTDIYSDGVDFRDYIERFADFTFDEQTNTYKGPYYTSSSNGEIIVKDGFSTQFSFANGQLISAEIASTGGAQQKLVFSDYGTTEVIPPAEDTESAD